MSKPILVQTPEHVAIELRGAGLGRRFSAAIIDLIAAGALAGLVSQIGLLIPGALGRLVAPAMAFVVFWGYHMMADIWGSGQTLGKRIFRLRVVDERGLPVGALQSMVRNVVRVLDLMPAGGIGMLSALIDPAHRRLGDFAAGTLVVADVDPPAWELSAQHARRVNSFDRSEVRHAVRHRIGLAEREFLVTLCLRSETLDPSVRYDLFELVGADLAARLTLVGHDTTGASGEAIVRGVVALFARHA